ncbi:MAG: hypothetical protein K0S32_3121 [Bacteroidetes bacterium]|jgi:hypothetical protein|nr:hypothetical protein [Bacteroidota bacterium]
MKLPENSLKEKNHSIILVFFIYLSVFINSYVFFKEPFEFYFGYLIFIVLLPVFISRYGLNRNLFFIFFALLVAGIVNILMNNNTSSQFFKVYTGLTLSYFFYYYVIVEFDYDIEKLFKWYLKGCYIVALIGIFQFVSFLVGFTPGYNFNWILNKWGLIPGGNFGIRVNSIFAEPTHLGAVLSAAFFISLYNVFRKETYYLSKFQSSVIIVVYLLSFSGLGQAGIFLTFIFMAINFGLARYIFLLLPVSIMLFTFLYNNVKDFRERYQSTIDLFTTGKFELGKTHGSSFILYNNYNIALENFKTNFVFGTGIGSHPVAFEKYSLAKDFKVYGFNLNSADANSMLLRLISETGLFGVLIFLILMVKCYVRRNVYNESYHWLVSNAILIMIMLNLFRQGHYFLNGFPFFVLLYYFNWAAHNKFLENQSPSVEDNGTVTVKEEPV